MIRVEWIDSNAQLEWYVTMVLCIINEYIYIDIYIIRLTCAVALKGSYAAV